MNVIQQQNYQVINAIIEMLAPVIKAQGTDTNSLKTFVYQLLIVNSAIAEQVGISQMQFNALASAAYSEGQVRAQRPQLSN